MTSAMLSTIDNPYNPFKDFDKWYQYDLAHGYNSCGYLARIANVSDALPESVNAVEVERAIDEIVNININGMYCKVTDS